MANMFKNISRIVITSDVLKVDDRQIEQYINPQSINIDWLKVMVGPILNENDIKLNVQSVYGTEGGIASIRWKIYEILGLPVCSSSWALLYEGNYGFEIVKEELSKLFNVNDLIVGFELPPYFIKACQELGIFYIDFTNHPVRFLPDYMFGIRTNIEYVRKKLELSKIEDKVIRRFANVSKMRTVRCCRNAVKLGDDCAVFMGQIEIDSSLIMDGAIAGIDEIENALISLSLNYKNVLYKAHPHAKNLDALKDMVSKIKGCKWLEMNAYDVMALENVSLIASMSSGSLYEAKYFDKKVKYFLREPEHFNYKNPNKNEVYYPIYINALNPSYWHWLLFEQDLDGFEGIKYPDPYDGAVKFSLNMKWGR